MGWFAVVTLLQGACARFAELYSIIESPADQIIPLTLTGRLEPPITFLLTRLLFERKPQTYQAYLANIITATGVVTALLLVPFWQGVDVASTMNIPCVLLTLVATFLDSIGGGISYLLVKDVPLPIYLMFRSGAGAVIFFFVAYALFGIEHFYGCWKPKVLEYMLAWSGGYILLGNLLWCVAR
jgi:hypothetical protein